MQFVASQSGGAPVIKKFQVAATLSVGGIPLLVPTLSDGTGVRAAATNAAADCIGVSLDAVTVLTAQQTDSSDPERKVSVIVNSDAYYKAYLNNGQTDGTALPIFTNTTAETAGTTLVIGAGDFATGYDDGCMWGYTGNNAGVLRKATAVATNAAVFLVAMPYDIANGDTFLAATFGPGEDAGFALTSNLVNIDATVDLQSTDNLRCVELFGGSSGENGRSESYAVIWLFDHYYSGAVT